MKQFPFDSLREAKEFVKFSREKGYKVSDPIKDKLPKKQWHRDRVTGKVVKYKYIVKRLQGIGYEGGGHPRSKKEHANTSSYANLSEPEQVKEKARRIREVEEENVEMRERRHERFKQYRRKTEKPLERSPGEEKAIGRRNYSVRLQNIDARAERQGSPQQNRRTAAARRERVYKDVWDEVEKLKAGRRQRKTGEEE